MSVYTEAIMMQRRSVWISLRQSILGLMLSAGLAGFSPLGRLHAASSPSPDLSARLVFQILASEFAIQAGDLRSAAAIYLRLAQQTEDPAVAQRAAQLLLAIRAPEQGLETAQIWLKGEPDSLEAQDMVDLLSVVLGRIDSLSQSLSERRDLARQQGDLDLFYERVSQLAMRSPQPQLGLQLLEQVSATDPNHPTPLYHRAMLQEQLKNPAEMERLLRRLISLHPDHAHALNALGYSLADRNIQLPEAQQLIEKAHGLEPESAHIIDSLGWLYYRLGRLPEARLWLSRALAKQPDVEIGAHLGEVLWRLDLADEAMTVLREANGRDPNNRVLRETLDRLGVRFAGSSSPDKGSPGQP